MNTKIPNVGLRNEGSTDNIFVQYFGCRVLKEEATKLPKFQILVICNGSQNSEVTI